MPNPVQLAFTVDSSGAIRGWRDFTDGSRDAAKSVDQVSEALDKQAEKAEHAAEATVSGQRKGAAAATEAQKAFTQQGTSFKAAADDHQRYVERVVQGQQQIAKAQATSVSFQGTSSWTGSSASMIDGVLTDTKKLDEAFKKAAASGKKGLDDVHEHALQPIDALRQVRDVLGIQIPQAMEKVIAQSPMLAKGLMAVSGLAVAGGAASIFFETGAQAYEAYKHVTDVNEGLREFTVESEKSLRQQIIDNAPLEQGIRNTRELTREIEALEKKKRDAHVGDDNSGSMTQYARAASLYSGAASSYGFTPRLTEAPNYDSDDDKAYAQRLADREHQKAVTRQQMQQLALARKQAELSVAASGLQGPSALAAQQRSDQELAQFKAQQEREENSARLRDREERRAALKRQNPEAKDNELPPSLSLESTAGEAQLQSDLFAAQQAGVARRRQLALQASEELIQINHAGRLADLRGEDVYQQQSIQAYEDFVRKYGNKVAGAQAAFESTYAKQRAQRLQQEQIAADQGLRNASVAGKQGVGRTEAQLSADLANVDDDVRQKKYIDPADAEKARAAARARAAADAAQQSKQYLRELDSEIQSSVDEQLDGFARIGAESTATLTRMRQQFDDLWGTASKDTAEYAAALQKELQAESAVRAAEVQKRARLQRDNNDETLSMEAEARRKSMPLWLQGQQEIIDSYAERRRKLDESLADDQVSWQDYNRRVGAMDREKNAELVQNAKDTRDRLAGSLQNFFRDPMGALRAQAEQAMARNAADMLLQFGGKHTGLLGVGGQSGSPLSGLPIIQNFARGAKPAATGSASSTMQVSTATIYVGAASFSGALGGGASVAGPIFGGGSSAPSTSATTSLLGGGGAPAITSGGMAFPTAGASPFGDPGAILDGAKSSVDTVNQFGSAFGKDGAGDEMVEKAKDKFDISDETAAKISGVAGGAMGLLGAYQSKSILGGMMGGALSGAKLGMALGGPMGAAIGAAAGIALGLLGDHGKSQAKQYDEKTVKPWIAGEFKSFEQGGGDYLTIYSDMDAFSASSKAQTSQWGKGAESYYNDTIKPEIAAAQVKLTKLQKAGRTKFGFTAAQYHSGDLVNSFGDFATGSNEGMIHAQLNEFMVRPAPAKAHLPTLRAINSGISPEELASSYRNSIDTAQQQRMAQAVTRNLHLTVHAVDTRSFLRLFSDNVGGVRTIINDSFGDAAGFGS